jgi:hypothetical protein
MNNKNFSHFLLIFSPAFLFYIGIGFIIDIGLLVQLLNRPGIGSAGAGAIGLLIVLPSFSIMALVYCITGILLWKKKKLAYYAAFPLVLFKMIIMDPYNFSVESASLNTPISILYLNQLLAVCVLITLFVYRKHFLHKKTAN